MMDNKPYVICHVISSLDGRISGGTFQLDETIRAMDEHWKIRADYSCEAVLNGSITAAEIYADGLFDDAGEAAAGGQGEVEAATGGESPAGDPGISAVAGGPAPEDFAAETDLDHYVVCVDPDGRLKWSRNYVDRPVQPKSHVIEVLLETVPEEYTDYLRSLNISYVFAGRDEFDARLLMEKLVRTFGIKRLMITGGGTVNWTMLEAGLIDEVNVIITPTASGEKGVATIFDRPEDKTGNDRPEDSGKCGGVPMELLDARKLEHGAMFLSYRPQSK